MLSAALQGKSWEPRLRKFKATKALPGTYWKIQVLRERAEKGLPLWHPDDPVFVRMTEPEAVAESMANGDVRQRLMAGESIGSFLSHDVADYE